MNKILITGANGFIGKEVCNVLRGRGILHAEAVRCAASSEQVGVGHINGTTDWSNALIGCDSIIHLAARVHVMKDGSSQPIDAYREVNLNGTINLAKQAARAGVRRFLFVSSIKVNGEVTENGRLFTPFDIPAPHDPYGQSKLEAESALRALSAETGLEIVIVRPPLVYGPGVRANFLKLMRLVWLGLPLPLGGVENRRSMISLDNLVDFLMCCVQHPAAVGQTLLISDGYDLSISELIKLMADAMEKRISLIPIPAKTLTRIAKMFGKLDLANRLLSSLQVDISHSRNLLQWQPVIAVAPAIQKTVSNFLAMPSAAK